MGLINTMGLLDQTIEIVVFGKGVGESILFRVKDDKWIVIDSFIEPSSKLPIALKYFRDNNMRIDDIVGILCTHWDDDHIRGISDIIKVHSNTLPVVMPIVLKDKRVREYVKSKITSNTPCITEFMRVLELKRQNKCSVFRAISDRNLYRREINDRTVVFIALSPNDDQYEDFFNSIVLSDEIEKKRGSSSFENSISIATYAETNGDSILLGGDLENSKNGGWKDICKNSNTLNKCHVIKVPHHGSVNAYYDDVWSLLVEKPIAIVTRYNNSHLPKKEVLDKMYNKVSHLFIVGAKPKKDKNLMQIDKKFHGEIKDAQILESNYGYVRLYKGINDTFWNIDTYGAVEEYMKEERS